MLSQLNSHLNFYDEINPGVEIIAKIYCESQSELESGSNGDSRRSASNIRIDIAAQRRRRRRRVIDTVGSDGGALSILGAREDQRAGSVAFALISITRSRLSSPRCLRIISDSISAETLRLSITLSRFFIFFFADEYAARVQIFLNLLFDRRSSTLLLLFGKCNASVTRLLIRFLITTLPRVPYLSRIDLIITVLCNGVLTYESLSLFS